MAEFDITSAGDVPPHDQFVLSPAVFPVGEIMDDYRAALGGIEEAQRLRKHLDPYNFRRNGFTDAALVKIVDSSRSYTRGVEFSSGMLSYWEVYRLAFFKSFSEKIAARADEIKGKAVGRRKERLDEIGVRIKGIPLRSVHLMDNPGDSTAAMARLINRIETDSGSTLSWRHLSTYTSGRSDNEKIQHVKDKSHWTGGIVTDGLSVANIRAWKNKITTDLKTADIITVCDTLADANVDPTSAAIVFALMCLNTGGYAVIKLEDFSSAAAVSCIHLFSMCFESAKIVHIYSEDALFLLGVDFKGNITARLHAKLYAICEAPTVSLFPTEYMNGEGFVKTVDSLMTIVRAATEWRLAEYDKLFRVYTELGNVSSKIFAGQVERILAREYPDLSKKWLAAVEL
jgi:hypothetical protein